jgi:hypothetical protein
MDVVRIISAVDWSPGIGDPSVMGWITVALYFVCAYKCYSVYSLSKKPLLKREGRERLLWLCLLISLIALGINKQLDLQSLFTEIGREISKQQGWYRTRRVVQEGFIQAVIVFGGLLAVSMFLVFKRQLKTQALAIVGFCILIVALLRFREVKKMLRPE